MEKRNAMLEVVLNYGKFLSIKKMKKELSLKMQSIIKREEKDLLIAKNWSDNYGGFEDCGDSYNADYERSIGRKSLANEMLNIIDVITLNLIKAEKKFKFLKHKFVEDFGQENLDELNNSLKMLVAENFEVDNDNLKKEKEKIRKLNHVVQVLIGHRFIDELIENHNSKGQYFISNAKNLKAKKIKIVEKYNNKSENKILEILAKENQDVIFEAGNLFLNEFKDELKTDKMANFYKIIEYNLRG